MAPRCRNMPKYMPSHPSRNSAPKIPTTASVPRGWPKSSCPSSRGALVVFSWFINTSQFQLRPQGRKIRLHLYLEPQAPGDDLHGEIVSHHFRREGANAFFAGGVDSLAQQFL